MRMNRSRWSGRLFSSRPVTTLRLAVLCDHAGSSFAHFMADSANELDKFKDFRFVKVDIDDLKAVAEEVGVSKPATFHMYKNGQKTNDLQSNQQDDLIKFLETGL